MIGVPEDDLGVQLGNQVPRQDAFDGRLRADGHENRGFNDAVGGVEQPGPGSCFGAGGLEFESEHRPYCMGLVFSQWQTTKTDRLPHALLGARI
jgi:hypothetical protein